MCFGCSKEPSHWDGTFEYPQHMFWLRNKKIKFWLRTLNWSPVNYQLMRNPNIIWHLSSGFPTRTCPKQPAQLQKLPRKFKISLVASLDMMLSIKQSTKVLIRLHECASWSAPLLFACNKVSFSPAKAHSLLVWAFCGCLSQWLYLGF